MAQEFAELGPKLGYACSWLAGRSPGTVARVEPDGLAGGLWSSSEFTVDPRQLIQSLPGFLEERYNVQFLFSTAVIAITTPGCSPGWPVARGDNIVAAAATLSPFIRGTLRPAA